MTKLRGLLRDAAELLDPQRQGNHWPDPTTHDGRPLADQARDMLVLLEARIEAADLNCDEAMAREVGGLADRIRAAAKSVARVRHRNTNIRRKRGEK